MMNAEEARKLFNKSNNLWSKYIDNELLPEINSAIERAAKIGLLGTRFSLEKPLEHAAQTNNVLQFLKDNEFVSSYIISSIKKFGFSCHIQDEYVFITW
jgi:hypothetical protein